MKRAVIFDLDGTLTRSEEGIWNCVRQAVRTMGLEEPDAETLRRFIGPPLAYSFANFMHLNEEQVTEAVRLFRARYATVGLFENRVYPGIRRLLRMLRDRGDYIAVATGKLQDPADRILAHFGLTKFFDKVVGTGLNAGAEKKELILRALPDQFDEAWMVGDTRFDVQGGHDAGIFSVGAGYGYGGEAELRDAGCDHYAPTVQALIDFFCPGQQPPQGAFLSMEGLDGSGKTTQLALLTDALDRMGFEVVHSREPGGCKISEAIRQVILSPEYIGMTPVTEALLYAASRAQHVQQVILPVIDSGKVLLCDRYVDSSVAYQGGGRQLGVDQILRINQPATAGVMPIATVYLDIAHETALRRRLNASEPDRIEMEKDAFHARTEQAYHELIARDPDRFIVVDATGTPAAIGEEAARRVLARLMEAEDA